MSDADSTPPTPPTPTSTLPNDPSTARPFRFTWDPSSRRRGPESVSGTTEGRGGDYITPQQPRLGFLNTSSTATLTLGALPSEWSSARHGFNAISTVLNHPSKRQAPPKAHSTLPAVPPADLPRVRRKDFDSYLRTITPEWERYERNSQLGRDGQAQLDGGPPTPRASLSSAINTPTSTTSSLHTQFTPAKVIPPLDSVPPIFFDPTFDLGNPRTFTTVTEHDNVSPARFSKVANGDVPADPPLLDRLSQYADTVEQHLIKEISLRSTSFFAALTNLQDLQAESVQCLDRIARMRRLLRGVDEQGAKRGLEIVRMESKLLNVNRVQDGIRAISGVVEMSSVAKGLVDAGQWGQALDMIEELERLQEGPNECGMKEDIGSPLPPVAEEDEDSGGGKQQHSSKINQDFRLSSLQAFAVLPAHLRDLTMGIAVSLSSEVVGVLRIDLNERISGDNLDENNTVQNLRDRLIPLLHGLVRTNGLKGATLSWREVVLGEIKGIVKAKLPGFDLDDENDGSGLQNGQAEYHPLTDYLRNMSHADFTMLMRGIYQTLFINIRGIQTQGSVFLEVIETVVKNYKSRSQSDTTLLQEDFTDILGSAAELAHIQVARLIPARTEVHAELDLPEFLEFFHDSWDFIIRSETLCGRMFVGLRGVIISQARAFLQAFHQVRLTRSAKLVEDEQWSQTEVSPALQHLTETILDCAIRNSPELVIKTDDPLWSSSPSTTLPTDGTSESVDNVRALVETNSHSQSAQSASATKNLRIEDRTYFVVSATSEVLVLLQDYLRLVINLSLLTTDTMNRVIEFLKAFNSRICQVVLGGGATRSAGLKYISAKHLSLASQSLSVMFELVPYVRETFRRHLSPKQAVMLVEFDKLKRDFQEHQKEIHAKLIGIMSDRLNGHIKSLQNMDWSTPKPENAVNDYMEILVRETILLHKVLTRYLATSTVEYVMTQVLAAINHRLSEEYGKIDIPDQEAKTRLLADAKYLHQKLSALKHIGTPSSMLETVITERRIVPAAEVTQVASLHSDQSPQRKPLSRSTTMNSVTASANQRLRGLLSGRSPTFDKMMGQSGKETPSPPQPMPRAPSPGMQPSASASVISLSSIGGGLSSANASTITFAESGGGAGGIGIPKALSGSPEASDGEPSTRSGFEALSSEISETSETIVERNSPCEEDGLAHGDVAFKTDLSPPE